MSLTLAQFDDFAPDAAEVRAAVLAGGFTTETGPDGLPYTGISTHAVPQWGEALAAALGCAVRVKLAVFRLNLAGEKPHSWIHSDGLCATKWAGVLYLTQPEHCQGGTAFWRHRALNLHTMPTEAQLTASGQDPDWFYGMMQREWQDLTWWEMQSLVGMRFNRLIVYPTCFFHSRYPFHAFGDNSENGRLAWCVFFD